MKYIKHVCPIVLKISTFYAKCDKGTFIGVNKKAIER